ncbi:MAG: TetR/AcrR family transcriptional regulator [Candidatus Ornithospirochaeta sp.]
MANKVDVRIVKSKESLMSAIIGLMGKKKLEELTISEICQEADVNRNTFYSHYSSVRELFEEMNGKYMEALFASAKVFDEPNDSTIKNLVNVLDKMKEKGNLTKIIFSESNSIKHLNTLLQILFPTSIIDNLKIENLSLEECHAFLIGGITSLILRWIENDFQESPKNFGRKIFNFIEEIKLF